MKNPILRLFAACVISACAASGDDASPASGDPQSASGDVTPVTSASASTGVPNPPTLISPAADAEIETARGQLPADIVFEWAHATPNGAVTTARYDVCVGDASSSICDDLSAARRLGLSAPGLLDPSVETSLAGDQLLQTAMQGDEQLHWTVRACAASGGQNCVSAEPRRLRWCKPLATSLAPNGPTSSYTPTFSWDASPNADRYMFCISSTRGCFYDPTAAGPQTGTHTAFIGPAPVNGVVSWAFDPAVGNLSELAGRMAFWRIGVPSSCDGNIHGFRYTDSIPVIFPPPN